MKKILISSSLALALVFSLVLPVWADSDEMNNSLVIETDSEATVHTSVVAAANTGVNSANGGNGGMGGNGGIISGSVEDGNSAGDGGNGGDGGQGGIITTGDASADVVVENNLNSTDITVDPCACEEGEESVEEDFDQVNKETRVWTRHRSNVTTEAAALASTGVNIADAGQGGDGGQGGDLDTEDADDNNTAGMGGQGGQGGMGGDILTGSSRTSAHVMNSLNHSIIRVRR